MTKKDLRPKPLYEELYDNLVFARKFYISIIIVLMIAISLITVHFNEKMLDCEKTIDQIEKQKD